MQKDIPYIGVTGGIGSGKSTLSKLLEISNIPVYNADNAAKRLMNESEAIRSKIDALTGNSFYIKEVLDKVRFAKWLFSDISRVYQVNQIVHPVVALDFLQWAKSIVLSRPMVVAVAIEAAILLEADFDRFVDHILLVDAPLEQRISRTMLRDRVTYDQVMNRVNAQISDSDRRKRATYIINNGNDDAIIPQVNRFIEFLQK